MFKSPLMNESALSSFCSNMARVTTMMVNPFDAFLENPVPGLQGLPLKYAFGHSPALCWSVATFDFVLLS